MSPDPIWTDGVTPLNSVNMTKLQTRDEKNAPSGYVGLDSGKNAKIDGYVLVDPAGAGSAAFAAYVPGDTVNRYLVDNNGKITWGPGNVAGDTNLYRSSANILATDDTFRIFRPAVTDEALSTQIGGSLYFSVRQDGYLSWVGDTNLYRAAAGSLKTDGQLFTVSQIVANYGTANTIQLGGDGKLYFGNAADTNLYRSAAAILQTDGMLSAQVAAGGAAIATRRTGDSGWGWYVNDRGLMNWGVAAGTYDTNLYRSAASDLRTDGNFRAGNSMVVDQNSGGSKLYFGSALDTNLYRTAAGALQTDGAFYATGAIQANYTTSNLILLHTDGKLYFGNAADTNLYRSAAGTLRTSGSFNADGNINAKTGAGVTNGECALGNYGPGGASALWLGPSEILYRLGSGIIATGSFACTFPGQGLVTAHALEVGAADSGGAGKRMVVVGN